MIIKIECEITIKEDSVAVVAKNEGSEWSGSIALAPNAKRFDLNGVGGFGIPQAVAGSVMDHVRMMQR